MSDTPETDANECWPASNLKLGKSSVVPSNIARKLERERDEARGAIKSTIAWLQSRRNAPDFTTMGMVEERLLKALEAAK